MEEQAGVKGLYQKKDTDIDELVDVLGGKKRLLKAVSKAIEGEHPGLVPLKDGTYEFEFVMKPKGNIVLQKKNCMSEESYCNYDGSKIQKTEDRLEPVVISPIDVETNPCQQQHVLPDDQTSNQ